MKYLDADDVIAANKAVIAQFGGTHAILNRGNLNYCVESIRDLPDKVEVIATRLIFCLISNHPFLDGNKRTAFNVTAIFLKLNRYRFDGISPEEAVIVLSTVTDETTSEQRLQGWVSKHLRRISV